MVTGATYHKTHFFDTPKKMDRLMDLLLEHANRLGWEMQAWAVFPNHYHFVAYCAEEEARVKRLVSTVHTKSAAFVNELDGTPGRRVWYNFRDKRLTYPASYYARLHYVHQNPVKHRVAVAATQYRWCSASWFQARADGALYKTVYSFPIDRLNIEDDF